MSARLLFWLIQAMAVGLLGLVLVAPLLETNAAPLRLFAHDAMLRQTALASGLALLATAWIFFRPTVTVTASDRSRRSVPPPVIGA